MMITRIVNYAVNVWVGLATFQTIIKGLLRLFSVLPDTLKRGRLILKTQLD